MSPRQTNGKGVRTRRKPLPRPSAPPNASQGLPGASKAKRGSVRLWGLARLPSANAVLPASECFDCALRAGLVALAQRLAEDAADADLAGEGYQRASYYRGRYAGEAFGLRRVAAELAAMVGVQ